MSALPPWASGPFDLLVHAEGHLIVFKDFDRRIALITFDNSIEVSITTYLALHPIQRSNRTYQRTDVEKWLSNYHSKLDFLEEELTSRGLAWEVDKAHIIWAHDSRNEQYHGGQKGTPESEVLTLVRKAALWIFSVLYDVANVDGLLQQAIASAAGPAPPQRNVDYDKAIDRKHGVIDVCEQSYYSSEVLFAVDADEYTDYGQRLCANPGEKPEAGDD